MTSSEAIRTLLEGCCDRRDEAQILKVLREVPADDFDEVVGALDLKRLFSAMDDRILGPDHRTALRHLLCDTRLSDLSVPSRAKIIRVLQHGHTDDHDEQGIVRLILETKGPELTRLKNLLNEGGDHRDLQRLVWSDLDDAQRRHTVLSHLAREARPTGELKVLSDIDDTFYENWKDTRYPPKTVYPGVLQFYTELDIGPDEKGRKGDLTFVSARPTDPLGAIERVTLSTLRGRGIDVAAVLTGSVLAARSNEAIATKKLENFLQYQALYPEYSFVFVGDSGQGDITFGLAMRERAPDAVRGVFIHDVVDTPLPRRDQLAMKGVYLFDTYVGAATRAFTLNLISREGLVRVGKAAEDGLRRITFETDAQKKARRDELTRDLGVAATAQRARAAAAAAAAAG